MEDIKDELLKIAEIEKEHELKNKPETKILYCAFVKYINESCTNLFAYNYEDLAVKVGTSPDILKFVNKYKDKYTLISNTDSIYSFKFLWVQEYEVDVKKIDEVKYLLIKNFKEEEGNNYDLHKTFGSPGTDEYKQFSRYYFEKNNNSYN